MNIKNSETINQIIQSFLIGYSIGNVALRVRNNPPLTINEANIIESIESLSKTKQNINSVLAASIATSESTTSITIKNLEKKGYVKRVVGTNDKRNHYLVNTALTSNVLSNVTEFHAEHNKKLLSKFNEAEIDQVIKAVLILQNALNQKVKSKFNNFVAKQIEVENNQKKKDFFYSIFVNCFYLMANVQEIILEELNSDSSISELIFLRTILGYETLNVPVSNGLIAFALKVANPTISLTLKRLESKKYIKRSFDKKDRRSIIITTSAKARILIQNNFDKNAEMLEPVLDSLSIKEKELFYNLFLNMRDFFLTLKFE